MVSVLYLSVTRLIINKNRKVTLVGRYPTAETACGGMHASEAVDSSDPYLAASAVKCMALGQKEKRGWRMRWKVKVHIE